jgi:hypothetical protein
MDTTITMVLPMGAAAGRANTRLAFSRAMARKP